MKKILPTLIVPSVFLFLASCSNSPEKASPAETGVDSTATRLDSAATRKDTTTAKVDTPVSKKEREPITKEEKRVCAFLRHLYEDYVLNRGGDYDFRKIKSHFSPEIVTALTYSEEDNIYSIWDFGAGSQEHGPTNETRVKSIMVEDDGWYKVSFVQEGRHAWGRFKAELRHEKVYISDWRTSYQYGY